MEIREYIESLLTAKNFDHNRNSTEYEYQFFHNLKQEFKETIFKGENNYDNYVFADLFAQTIIYGAFSSWVKFSQSNVEEKNNFSLKNVDKYLPFGSFLCSLFKKLNNEHLPHLEPLIKEIETILAEIDFNLIYTNTETLITTFYSDFLKLYSPETAKDRGIEYTPFEIVEFMVKGIDFALKKWLNQPDGIITVGGSEKFKEIRRSTGTGNIQILDPASGTMAFASGFLHVVKQKFEQKYAERGDTGASQLAFDEWVKKQFFPNMKAFEILMAPYILGQIRILLKLDELGLTLNSDQYNLRSYLMNALINTPDQSRLDSWNYANHETTSNHPNAKIRKKTHSRNDILVIMGNPPYNLSSQNNCDWINHKILDYKRGLDEKNKKILSDDYVKFIRFGQWKIEAAGCGVLAFITNNKYLDGQMFSVMRKSLRATFDQIYIVNLHGDMRKKEAGNPFDIRVGVSIAFMVRVDNSPNKNAAIHYMDIPQNSREEKFGILAQGFLEDRFKLLPETGKNYFVEIDTTNLDEFESYLPINKFFHKSPTSGIMAGRDHLLMDVDRENLLTNLSLFFNRRYGKLEALKIKIHDTKSWSKAKVFRNTNFEEVSNTICRIRYRGFDFRYLAYQRDIVEGHRMGYIDQIANTNPAITVTKASRRKIFENAFISSEPIEKCYMSVVDTAYAFPLSYNGRSNVNLDRVPFRTSAEELFYYLYGILHTPQYRRDFNAYLLKYYPRIPVPSEPNVYREVSVVGKKLADLHLLKCPISTQLVVADLPPKKWLVKDFYYDPSNRTLFLGGKIKPKKSRDIPFIQGVNQEVWDFSIGNVPQIAQFLKSRQFSSARKWNTLQRPLNPGEVAYLLTMISALNASMELFPKLDEKYSRLIDKDLLISE